MSGSKEKSRSEILSANIKQYLKINGLKESEAAALASLNPTTLNSWIREVSFPRMRNLKKLADALKIELEDLLEDKREGESAPYLSIREIRLLRRYHSDPEFSRYIHSGILLSESGRLGEMNGIIESHLK